MNKHNTKKSVLLLTSRVGQGHISASEAIEKALIDYYSEFVDPIIINVLDHPDAPTVLREGQNDYDKIAKDWPQLHELARRMTDSQITRGVTEMAHIVMLYKPISNIIKEFRPDVIVALYPSYQSSILVYLHQHHSRIPLITVPTDLGMLHRLWFHPGVDLCLVPNEPAQKLARKNGLLEHQVKVTGLPVNPRFTDSQTPRPDLRRSLGWHPTLYTLLVVGSNRVKDMETFTNLLDHAGLPIQIILVAGGNDALYQHFLGQNWRRPVSIYNFVENMPEFMLAADGIISKAGGLITAESLAAGLPIMFIQALLKHEMGNAAYVVEHEAGDLAEEPPLLLATVRNWFNNEGALFKFRAQNARSLGRPGAAYSVAEMIMRMAHEELAPRPGLENEGSSLRDLFQYFGLKLNSSFS